MNEITLRKDTVLRLGPGVTWNERERCVLITRGRGRIGAAARRAAIGLAGIVLVAAITASAFVAGVSTGGGIGASLLADAGTPSLPAAIPSPPSEPRPRPAAAPRPAQSAPNQADPFGVMR